MTARGTGLALVPAAATRSPAIRVIPPADYAPPPEAGRALLALLVAIRQRQVDATVDATDRAA